MALTLERSASMHFDDAPREAEFRAEAREWLTRNAPPAGDPADFSKEFWGIDRHPPEDRPRLELEHAARCRAWQAKLYEGGWAGITWPVEHGGRGGTPIEAMIFAEEQARFGVSVDVLVVALTMVGPTLMAHGSPEQQARFLPAILRGEEVWCQLFSEPAAGSDLAALATRAVRDGDEWVVNGQKVWTSSGNSSDWGILLARTDPDVPKHKGISYFLLDMRAPGVDVRPLRQMTGGSHFCEVFLTDVRIPDSMLVGGAGEGWRVAMTTLNNERVMIGGGTHFTVADVADLARRFGRLGDPAVRLGLADLHTREQVLRFFGYRVRTALGRGELPGSEASCMKLAVARYLQLGTALALAVAGPDGMLAETDGPGAATWQNHFLSAPSIRIAGGSDEVQRTIIGERVLGLPREQRDDRSLTYRELVQRPAQVKETH